MADSVKMSVELGGQEMPFNLYDAETAAAYEQALVVLREEDPQTETLSQLVSARVGSVRKFLDILFGDGTAWAVLGGRDDLNAALDCVEAVTRAAAEQTEAMRQRVAAYRR